MSLHVAYFGPFVNFVFVCFVFLLHSLQNDILNSFFFVFFVLI